MGSGHHRFGLWISEVGLSLHQVATLLGCSFGMVGHLRAGRRKPGRRLAARIQEVTATGERGPIAVTSWDPPRGEVHAAA